MAGKYASKTEVSPGQSRAAIEDVLEKYGATNFAYAVAEGRATVAFRANNRLVRISIPLPKKEDFKTYLYHGKTYAEDPAMQQKRFDQAHRQVWRALLLVVKAKLEAVEAEISTFEEEFLAFIVLPGGLTIYEKIADQLEHMQEGPDGPILLLGSGI